MSYSGQPPPTSTAPIVSAQPFTWPALRRLKSPQFDELMRRRRGHETAADRKARVFAHLRNRRVAELQRIIEGRHGGPLPDEVDDADLDFGGVYLTIAAQHCPPGQNTCDWLIKWASVWAPTWSREHLKPHADAADARQRYYSADGLGKLLKLTNDERTKFGIRTMRPCDLTPSQFRDASRERKKKADRERKAAERQASIKPPIPRIEYESRSKRRMEPWKQLGIGKSKYYDDRLHLLGS